MIDGICFLVKVGFAALLFGFFIAFLNVNDIALEITTAVLAVSFFCWLIFAIGKRIKLDKDHRTFDCYFCGHKVTMTWGGVWKCGHCKRTNRNESRSKQS